MFIDVHTRFNSSMYLFNELLTDLLIILINSRFNNWRTINISLWWVIEWFTWQIEITDNSWLSYLLQQPITSYLGQVMFINVQGQLSLQAEWGISEQGMLVYSSKILGEMMRQKKIVHNGKSTYKYPLFYTNVRDNMTYLSLQRMWK